MESPSRYAGALAAEDLRELIACGAIRGETPIRDAQIQPASLDLTLSAEAYKLPGSMLPLRHEGVRELLERFHARPMDLSRPTFLDRGRVYLVRLNESLDLPAGVGCYTNSKSSTGRIDLQTRTIGDGNPRYEKHRRGYRGEIWLEIIPKSFDVRLSAGVSLNQAIFYGDRRILDDVALAELVARETLVRDREGRPMGGDAIEIDQGLLMSIASSRTSSGTSARRSPRPLVLDEPREHAVGFFEPITRPRDGRLFLMKGTLHILSARPSSTCGCRRTSRSRCSPSRRRRGIPRALRRLLRSGFPDGETPAKDGTPPSRGAPTTTTSSSATASRSARWCERLTRPARRWPTARTGTNHYADQRGRDSPKYFRSS
ncbi:MAG: 2'-deoxycytidine 5'-triphosphate deaminase [Planctomycetota bacterium]